MNALPIPHDDHGTDPIGIRCVLDDRGRLSFYYNETTLKRHQDAIEVELAPTDGEPTTIELRFPEGRVTAEGDGAWDNPTVGIASQRFGEPTSDFLTINVNTTAANKTDTGKIYIKIKPHGGLPAEFPNDG